MNNTGKTCSVCFFATTIDENRLKCHVSRPTANVGFPKVLPSDYCSYWTDPQTMDRPFFYPVALSAKEFGVGLHENGGVKPHHIGREDNNENRPKDDA